MVNVYSCDAKFRYGPSGNLRFQTVEKKANPKSVPKILCVCVCVFTIMFDSYQFFSSKFQLECGTIGFLYDFLQLCILKQFTYKSGQMGQALMLMAKVLLTTI